jgi:rhamnosyltransferase
MQVGQPKIAVLLAAYNGMRWIEEQVNSILNQSNVELTLYISVDPSSDGTEAWCAAFATEHNNVVVLPPAGRFSSAARNFFRLIRDVDFSGFGYVAFSDQDDIWNSDKLERAVMTLQPGEYDAYSSNVTAFWPNGHTLLLEKAQPQVAWDYLFESAGPGCTYVLSQRLASHMKAAMVSSWDRVQSLGHHDSYCYAFSRGQGYSWFIDPVAGMRYRQHANNQVGANIGIFSFLSRLKTISEGRWFSQALLMADLVGKSEDPFVKRWTALGRIQLLTLAFSAAQCRRRVRDKVAFSVICCVAAIIGNQSK